MSALDDDFGHFQLFASSSIKITQEASFKSEISDDNLQTF